jgi:hypothetical protein
VPIIIAGIYAGSQLELKQLHGAFQAKEQEVATLKVLTAVAIERAKARILSCCCIEARECCTDRRRLSTVVWR